MPSIQFKGFDQTIKAFENRGAEAWSIWDGKAFMFRGVGVNELSALLESLSVSGSTAVYTLKVYEDITDVKKIKPSTEFDGSFNFRLFERDEYNNMPGYNSTRALEDRMSQFEDRILKILETNMSQDEEEEDDKSGDFVGTITGLLQDPDKLGKIINLGKQLLGQPVQPAYVGNVNKLTESGGNGGSSASSLSPSPNPNQAAPVNQMSQEEYEARVDRMTRAIDTLERNDRSLLEHLEQLAAMSVNKPDQFRFLIGMLDAQ